jgi:hypothetical protein
MAGKFAGHSPYNYVLGNPVIMIDPDGREAKGPITDKKKQRQQRRWNRKFQKKIAQPLQEMWASAVESNSSLTVADAEGVLGAEASRLASKHSKKNWLWGSKTGRTNGRTGKHSATGAPRVRTDVSILLTDDISRSSNGDDGRNPNGAAAFGQGLSVGVPDGSSESITNTASFTVTFDGNNEPDVLNVTGASTSNSLMSGQFGGLGSSPTTRTFTGAQTGGTINATVSRRPGSQVSVSRFNLSIQVSYLNIRRSTRVTKGVLKGR